MEFVSGQVAHALTPRSTNLAHVIIINTKLIKYTKYELFKAGGRKIVCM